VDGVSALHLDEDVVPGPLHACLMFGVGRSDETIPNAGITHVVEHLSLRSLGRKPYGWNGAVHLVTTRFEVIGRPEQVSEFLREVTVRLHDLPTERLADELKILRVEGDKRSRNQFGVDLGIRFGPTGAGLIDWREAGFHRLEADDIQQWAHHWFTAANAALWVSGPLPAELDLSALPPGERVSHRVPTCLTSGRTFVGEKTTSTSFPCCPTGSGASPPRP